MEKIFDNYGYNVLDRALRLCVGTWEGEQGSLSSNMLVAVARLCAAYGNDLSDTTFKERLGQYTAKSICRTAKERRPGSLGFAEALLINYNRKCKYRLSMKRLYGNKADEAVDFESDEEDEEQVDEE